MKRAIAAGMMGVAMLAVAWSAPSVAGTMPPPLPSLDSTQSSRLDERMKLVRDEVEARVARGEVTATEAGRLLAWREWQIARQIAGLAPPPPEYITPNYPPQPGETGVPPDYRATPPAPVYYTIPYPVYAPWRAYAWPYGGYAAPWPPFAWGATICGGGFGHHFRAGICF
ncbi:MAG: hypothetical protein JSS46_06215 [Proteobacteria bacterium]|nr:hypothetical protein [Pseudomonadota bacterium]